MSLSGVGAKQDGGRKRGLRFIRWILWAVVMAACAALPFATRELATDAELTVHDTYRYLLADTVEPLSDPEIVLLLYNDAVARETQRTMPVDRTMLAQAIRAADNAGAKAVGIDLIFIAPTDDQAVLQRALSEVSLPVYLAYADPDGDRTNGYWAPEIDHLARPYQDEFWSGIDNARVQRVSPVLRTGESGIARGWPGLGDDANPPLALAMGGATELAAGYEGAIRFSRVAETIESPRDEAAEDAGEPPPHPATGMFPAYPMNLVTDPIFAEAFAPLLAGKYVIIGTDAFAIDKLATPITRMSGTGKVAGMTVHAQMLRQALDRNFPPALGPMAIAILALVLALAGAATATIERRPALLTALLVAQLGAIAALPVAVKLAGYDYLSLPLIGIALAWLSAFLLVGYAVRNRTSEERAFARAALGKFLPASVAHEILETPEKLTLEGEERPLFMMFTDLEGFTRFSHGRDPRETARILNRYLEEMSAIVLGHEGTLDKFVGDAIVAFWGAPLSDDRDAARCVQCALDLHAASERLRGELKAEFGETFGRTRIGLHHGQVVVGNFGGARRIQYTALGDAMNIAARLEGANKYLRTDILASGEVRALAPDFAWRPFGFIGLSGVDTPVEVFEPVADPAIASLERLTDAMQRIEAGDAGAREALRRLHDDCPGDAALEALVGRLESVTRERPYVLGSK